MSTLDPKRTACIIGIDPGTEHLGLCSIHFDVITLELKAIRAYTFVGTKLPYFSQAIALTHGDKAARLAAHKENLIHVFRLLRPLAVASESPFFNMLRPNAYGPLVETITTIREALYEYDPYSVLHMIDPPSVKNAVGAKGGAKKEQVQEAILRLNGIPFADGGPQVWSEHARDSFAVAYARYRAYLPSPSHWGF